MPGDNVEELELIEAQWNGKPKNAGLATELTTGKNTIKTIDTSKTSENNSGNFTLQDFIIQDMLYAGFNDFPYSRFNIKISFHILYT